LRKQTPIHEPLEDLSPVVVQGCKVGAKRNLGGLKAGNFSLEIGQQDPFPVDPSRKRLGCRRGS
jgi:hypothetical protein